MPDTKQDGQASTEDRAEGEVRFLGRRLDRLTLRLALGTTFLVVAPLGIGFYALSQHHFDQTLEARQRSAELQTRVLEAALRHQMMEQDPSLMGSIFEEIGAEPMVRAAMILDHEGEIRVASSPDLVGQRIPQDSPTCIVCHSESPEERGQWTRIHEGDQELLRSVLPIENRSECHLCHSPDQRLNGILIVDTSLADLRAELGSDVLWFIIGTVLLGLMLLAGVRFLVRRLILVRLGRLGQTARTIASGDMRERAAVGGDDVITSLAGDFNSMADTVTQLLSDVRAQEAQLANVMNSLDDGLVVLDRQSRVLASNRSFCRRLSVMPAALRGRRCHRTPDCFLPCCESDEACPAIRCLATGESQRAVYQSTGRAAGRDLVEEVYASPILDQDGRVVQVVEIWRDITERVEEEQHMAEIERLVSLGTLASGFSHEVNTPLATMLTCAESVLGRMDATGTNGMDPETERAIRESATVIRNQVLRCRKVTDQFLRFSRGIPPGIEPLDLEQVVSGVLELVAPTAREAGVTLRTEGRAPSSPIRANAEVVQHVVLNLLVNAIQSTDGDRGSIIVRFVRGEPVRIQVEDDGPGIPSEARKTLFEPFRSRKPGGTGLGLFLSRSFMRRFGGDVRLVDGGTGRGACFEVSFSATAGTVA